MYKINELKKLTIYKGTDYGRIRNIYVSRKTKALYFSKRVLIHPFGNVARNFKKLAHRNEFIRVDLGDKDPRKLFFLNYLNFFF